MSRGPSMQFGVPMTKTVKALIIINVVIWFFLQIIFDRYFSRFGGPIFSKHFSLIPGDAVYHFKIWQFFTYQFLHTSNVTHILFNMLMLWWLGSELEQRWGQKFFLFYYLASGFGAAVIYSAGIVGYSYATESVNSLFVPVMGASGAIFGLLVAYGILFGERMIHFMMLFPMKAKHMVMIMGAIEVASLFSSQEGTDVANLAHLGGILSGYLVLQAWNKYLRHEWNQKAKKRQSKLKLVVNNDKSKTGEGPKYWN